jgi:hypothetical protein
LFRKQDFVSKSDFVEYTSLPERSAQRILKDWVESGIIETIGAGRGTKYRLNN